MSTVEKLPMIAGVEITQDEEGRFNLNALHNASGTKIHKRPSKWLDTPQAKELLLEMESQSPPEGFACCLINSVKGGAYPGTFAHELLAISYAGWISPKFQLQVNQVFLDYKSGKLSEAKPLSTIEILESALKAEKEKLKLEAEKQQLECQVLEFKPKVDALDRIATANGSLCLTDAAKTLQVRPIDLKKWLIENRWIYIRKGSTKPVAFQVRIDHGLLEHKETEYESKDDGGQPIIKIATQVRVLPKGLAVLGEQLI